MGKGARLRAARRAERLGQTSHGTATDAGTRPGGLTLIVETANGDYLRRIPSALPLPSGVAEGTAAEQAIHAAAAIWGLPDFVYRAPIRQVGSGVRELGDGALLIGQTGLLFQVKRRQGGGGNRERETAWIRKAVRKAVRQANGSVRSLRMEHAHMVNGRGRSLLVNGNEFHWLAVVIIDHDHPPETLRLETELAEAQVPAVLLTRGDWEFLFAQLKSAHAVTEYLVRVASQAVVPLGEESVRYYELAAADAEAPPRDIDPRYLGKDGVRVSIPLLPQVPAGHEDRRAHTILRIILEDIATSPMAESDENGRLRILSAIDTLAVAYREELGRTLLSFMDDVAGFPDGTLGWRMRRFLYGADKPQIAFAACTRFSEFVKEAFSQWVMMRHTEFGEIEGMRDKTTTVGVLLTPRRDGLRPWDTTTICVTGDLGLTEREKASIRELWSDQNRLST